MIIYFFFNILVGDFIVNKIGIYFKNLMEKDREENLVYLGNNFLEGIIINIVVLFVLFIIILVLSIFLVVFLKKRGFCKRI